MEQNCETLFPEFRDRITTFSETELSFPSTLVSLNDRLVSSPMYNHVIHTLRCITCAGRPSRILEIGGGYGAPGRIWFTNGVHRPDLYVDVDFPESLFYAEVFLRSTLPELDIVYFHVGDDPCVVDTSAPRVVLCPISAMGPLLARPFDVIVNTGSLQEMSEQYVDFYMSAIDRANCNRFYSSNYFGQPVNELLESMNFAAPVMSAEWSSAFHAYHDDARRPVAETLYVRGQTPSKGTVEEEFDAAMRRPLGSPAEFWQLFDLARRASSADQRMRAAAKAVLELPYIPKEVLHLARSGAATPSTSASDRALLRILERLAAESLKEAGIVDPTVAGIRERLRAERPAVGVPDGRFREYTEGPMVEIGGVVRLWRQAAGVIERCEGSAQEVVLSGWAFDQERGEEALWVHVFDSGVLVVSEAPGLQRPEFGYPGRCIGFDLRIPGRRPEDLTLIAEFADGSVGRLE